MLLFGPKTLQMDLCLELFVIILLRERVLPRWLNCKDTLPCVCVMSDVCECVCVCVGGGGVRVDRTLL